MTLETCAGRSASFRQVVSPSDFFRRVVTPKGASWVNQIETWFGIITRQSIRRGTFTSVKVLIGQIRDYITHWNPTPFVWTTTADETLAKVRLVQTNIKKLVDNNAK